MVWLGSIEGPCHVYAGETAWPPEIFLDCDFKF